LLASAIGAGQPRLSVHDFILNSIINGRVKRMKRSKKRLGSIEKKIQKVLKFNSKIWPVFYPVLQI